MSSECDCTSDLQRIGVVGTCPPEVSHVTEARVDAWKSSHKMFLIQVHPLIRVVLFMCTKSETRRSAPIVSSDQLQFHLSVNRNMDADENESRGTKRTASEAGLPPEAPRRIKACGRPW